MKMIVNRNSVCAADDTGSHKMEFTIPAVCDTFEKLFRFLDKSSFIPKPIRGNQEIWVCRLKTGLELFHFHRKTNEVVNSQVDMRMEYWLKKGEYKLFFTCYTPEKRAEEIFRKCEGSEYYMWHDGWEEEYKSYNIPKEVENSWRIKYGF